MKRMMKASVATVLLATAAFAANAKQASYEMVVLHAEGAALKRGAVIDGNQSLTLRAGSKVTLVGADGKTVTLQGPSTGKPPPRGRKRRKRSPPFSVRSCRARNAPPARSGLSGPVDPQPPNCRTNGR